MLWMYIKPSIPKEHSPKYKVIGKKLEGSRYWFVVSMHFTAQWLLNGLVKVGRSLQQSQWTTVPQM